MLVALAAQVLTVHFNYEGNWTGLFRHGALFPFPPGLAEDGVHVFPRTFGYDGQIYHLLAHDPFFAKGYARYLDDPRLRYRRILVPALAHLVSSGAPGALHAAYVALVLLAVGLGSYWLSRWALASKRSPLWGLSFLAVPATFVSVERLLADVVLAALAVGLVAYAERGHVRALAVIALLAPLTRETGLLLWFAAVAGLGARRETRRSAALVALAVLPTLAWYAFVAAHTAHMAYPASLVPLEGVLRAFVSPLTGPPAAPTHATVGVVHALWRSLAPAVTAALARVALAGAVLAMALGLLRLRAKREAPELAAACFAALALFLQRPDNWVNVYDYGRVYSPLLVVLLMRGLEERRYLYLAPLGLMVPSLVQQTTDQMAGIARALLR